MISEHSIYRGLLPRLAILAFLASVSLSAQLVLTYNGSGSLAQITPSSSVAPAIVAGPGNRLATSGHNASLTVLAFGSVPLTYQWFFNSNIVTGATGDSLLRTNITLADFGAYYAVVANSFGSKTSVVARLDLDADGDGLADNWEIAYFGSITNQNAAMDRDNDGISNVAEFRDGSNPTNATSYLPRLTVRAFKAPCSCWRIWSAIPMDNP